MYKNNSGFFWLLLLLFILFSSVAIFAQDASDPIVTENYNESVVDSTSKTKVESPPPSAISP